MVSLGFVSCIGTSANDIKPVSAMTALSTLCMALTFIDRSFHNIP